MLKLDRAKELSGLRLIVVACLVLFILVFVVWLVSAPGALTSVAGSRSSDHPPDIALDTVQPILALPPVPELPPLRVALGERLFRDTRFSADNTLSCMSCHDLAHGGVDGRKVSTGIGGAVGSINAPTVFNSSLSFAQFWDGRAATLEEQAAGPIHNPRELGSDWAQVLARLSQDTEMVAAFGATYPDGLTAANIADAIATFERSLLTLNSRFDQYLQGRKDVLSDTEVEGYRRFREFGCTSCHQGVLIGGNMFQKFGVLGDYFADHPQTAADLGRYNVTRREADRHVFKVPSLRNVALTAPYFHDGSINTLEQAVVIMGRYQLGRELTPQDVDVIVAFLKTLSGEWKKAVDK